MFLFRRRGKKETVTRRGLHFGPTMSRPKSNTITTTCRNLEKATIAKIAARRSSLILEGRRQTAPTHALHLSDDGGAGAGTATATAALTLKLDSLKLEMDPELPGWTAGVDLDNLIRGHIHRSRRKKRSKSLDGHIPLRKNYANAGDRPWRGHHTSRTFPKMPRTAEEVANVNHHLELANAELGARNNLIHIKNEVLEMNIAEKRLAIGRMHWEMLEMRESLDNVIEAHFLDHSSCPGHQHHGHIHHTHDHVHAAGAPVAAEAQVVPGAVIVQGNMNANTAVSVAAAAVAATMMPGTSSGKKRRNKNKFKRRK